MSNAALEDRSCGACTLCCKLVSIDALGKPHGVWCQHCAVGKGCKIYDEKPEECTTFKCLWLYDRRLDESWYPARSKCVLYYHNDGFIIAEIASENKALMRDAKYLALFKAYAEEVKSKRGYVIVRCGKWMYAVTPTKLFDLGATRAVEKIRASYDVRTGDILTVQIVE